MSMEDVRVSKRKKEASDADDEEEAPKKMYKKEGSKVDTEETDQFVDKEWKESILPTLSEFISIPNQSPVFDPEWNTNGYQEKAVKLFEDWVRSKEIPGAQIEVIEEEKRTSLLFIEIPGHQDTQETVLMYGHFDKQPPLASTWRADLAPQTPVIKDGKLYGRGGADDGYAMFASVTAIRALEAQKIPHARCVILIEGSEESGSKDLPFYVDKLSDRIGSPRLCVCLDSFCGNYEQLWLTTSLRGGVVGTIRVKLLNEGVHSGDASGIVPSTFRIMRQLLDRIEDPKSGQVLLPELFAEVPEDHLKFSKDAVDTLQDDIVKVFPFVDGGQPAEGSMYELQLNRAWRPTVSYTGISGLPDVSSAGNVLRPETILNLSIRLPPTVDCEVSYEALRKVIESDPSPYGAEVVFHAPKRMNGFVIPKMAPWLTRAVSEASSAYFNKPVRYKGEGGSIPFMSMLAEKFPNTQFLISGVLGPQSNAHGPNESLDIYMVTKLTACVASILSAHYENISAE